MVLLLLLLLHRPNSAPISATSPPSKAHRQPARESDRKTISIPRRKRTTSPTMPPTPTMSILGSSLRPTCPSCRLTTQIRQASLLRRPKRPYTFTQMITLSDGSTYLHRTTSPMPIYRSNKDTKNSPLWNPSSQKLANVEEDEAGRLKRFRGRFGRGWDAEVVTGAEEVSVFDGFAL